MKNGNRLDNRGLSVVIPAHDEEKYLPLLLDSIRLQEFDPLEVIVAVSPRTKDRTSDIASEYGCRVVEGGMAAEGRNNGVRHARFPLICFVDSDIILPKGFLGAAVSEFEGKGFDLAGTYQKPITVGKSGKDLLYRAFYGISNLAMRISRNGKRPKMQCCVFMKRDVFEDVGGFRNIFGEDSLFAESAVSLGRKFGMLNESGKVLISPRRMEKEGFLNMAWKYVRLNIGAQLGGYGGVSAEDYFGKE